MYRIPKEMLKSGYRKTMWNVAEHVIRDLERVFDISEAYVLGSFTTKKRRPADVDLIVFIKLKDRRYGTDWSVDLTLVPDNEAGTRVLKDTDLWMKQKYGKGKYQMVKIR